MEKNQISSAKDVKPDFVTTTFVTTLFFLTSCILFHYTVMIIATVLLKNCSRRGHTRLNFCVVCRCDKILMMSFVIKLQSRKMLQRVSKAHS